MNIKKTAKKIVAVSAGLGMAGATLMSALAVAPDLADYPSDFIVDGQFDGKIVVGQAAASQDIIGAIDIASSLQAASTSEVAVGDSTTTVSLEGDVFKIGDSGDMLEIGESISQVTQTITGDDLELLSSGRITTQKGSTDYSQLLRIGSTGEVDLRENNDDVLGNFLYFQEGQTLFKYELEFTSGLESDRETDGSLEDLEDEVLTFLGQEYTISAASAANDGTDFVLELLAGDVSDTLEQGQSRTYTVDGVDYEVTVLVVGTTTPANVRFLINGETTKSLEEGDTERIGPVGNNFEIGVRDIISSSRAFEGDQGSIVEFYLGANKIEFVDTNISSSSIILLRRNLTIMHQIIQITKSRPKAWTCCRL
jgi:hypothetical protein